MKQLLVLFLVAISSLAPAQGLDSVYAEVFYIDDGTVAGYPCGFSTYRIYAKVSSEFHRIDGIRSAIGSNLFIDSEGGDIFNTIWGAATGDHVNEGFWGIRPEAEYDSFVTINQASSGAVGG